MDISVLICTFNRADNLRLTLERLAGVQAPAEVDWELVVVDNNSRDHTPAVCRDFAAILPIRHVEERRQGLSVARNRGIKESRGGIIVYTDDDVNVEPGWISALWRASQVHPEAGFFGGKVVPLWPETPPPWIVEYSRGMLCGMTMDFNLGDEERYVEGNDIFFGANMAYRREAILKVGPFREDLGVNGTSLISHDESEYMWRLLKAGYRGLYVPEMVVHHRNTPERMTERYMLRLFSACGATHVRLGMIAPSAVELFNAPRYLWRRLASSSFAYLLRRLMPTHGNAWVPAARYMAITWGSISEYRRMAAERSVAPPKD